MSDVLIRDIPDDVLKAIDTRAAAVGLSRSEYLRRRLAQDAAVQSRTVLVADLEVFGETFAGLGDGDLMDEAWS